MKKGTQSTIESTKHFSPFRPQQRLEKTNSFRITESIVVGTQTPNSMRRQEKSALLNRSIEEQIKKAKQVCQAVKMKKSDCKTSREDNETSLSILANFRERGKIIENNQIFSKLRMQHPTPVSSPPKLPASPPRAILSLPKPLSPKITIANSLSPLPLKSPPPVSADQPVITEPTGMKISSLLRSGDSQGLQEVRQIESFVMEEDEKLQEMSIVEGHGSEVLDWGIGVGKASQFRVLKFLDQGKYGKVYLAQSIRNGVIYSIKSMYRHTLDDTSMQQLLREVKIQAFLVHPNVVRLYHFFVDTDCAYLVLEPCLGKNLYQNLKEVGRVPERTVKEWIRQVCTAVEFMHRHDVIHRDIKPQNILLHQNMVKICDFGWAVHSPLLRQTQCGTPLYTPPQLVQGKKYDSKIDVWSIGILTYELLYGTIPFQIRHNSDMAKIIEQEVYFSQETVVSEAAKDFMMSCLHKNPSERATVRQLLDHEFLARVDKFRWTII